MNDQRQDFNYIVWNHALSLHVFNCTEYSTVHSNGPGVEELTG